jgi:hypothetical protein
MTAIDILVTKVSVLQGNLKLCSVNVEAGRIVLMDFLILGFGFCALPAKEELSPMFPNRSSSDEISKIDAFIQNFKVYNFVMSMCSKAKLVY